MATQVYGFQTFHTMTIKKQETNGITISCFFVWQFMVHSRICMSSQPAFVSAMEKKQIFRSDSRIFTCWPWLEEKFVFVLSFKEVFVESSYWIYFSQQNAWAIDRFFSRRFLRGSPTLTTAFSGFYFFFFFVIFWDTPSSKYFLKHFRM